MPDWGSMAKNIGRCDNADVSPIRSHRSEADFGKLTNSVLQLQETTGVVVVSIYRWLNLAESTRMLCIREKADKATRNLGINTSQSQYLSTCLCQSGPSYRTYLDHGRLIRGLDLLFKSEQ